MLIIKCAKCKRKIFKYNKIGKGFVINCWHDQIIKDSSVHRGDKVLCPCGNIIGIDTGRAVKMRPRSFVYSGTVSKN